MSLGRESQREGAAMEKKAQSPQVQCSVLGGGVEWRVEEGLVMENFVRV